VGGGKTSKTWKEKKRLSNTIGRSRMMRDLGGTEEATRREKKREQKKSGMKGGKA